MSRSIPRDMRAAVWLGPDMVDVRAIPTPIPAQDQVLVKVEFTGLCGTDSSILHGTHPRATPPLIMGHEITGVVAESTEGGPAVGTRVAVEPLISCGVCSACKRGASHVCTKLGLYGIDEAGSMAEYVALPASTLVPLDGSVPSLQAALAEPLAVAVHAVSRAGLRAGDRVMVYGAGPIGMLTALVARNAGASQILISEPSEARRTVAEQMGFTTVPAGLDPVERIRETTDGDGADIVFDSAAHPNVAAVLSKSCRVLGTIVLVGVYKKPAAMDLQGITFAEQSLVGVRVYTRADVERAVELLEANALGLDRIPVAVYGLDDVDTAFADAMSAGEALKVLVSPIESLVTKRKERLR